MRVKRVASWLIPLVVISGLTYIFGYSSLLTVKALEFDSSAKRVEIQKIIARPDLNLQLGAKLARVNMRGAQRAIESVSWVEKVGISRNWVSGKISVSVTERHPIANVVSQSSGVTSLIDHSGSIFQDPAVTKRLPVVTIADPSKTAKVAAFIAEIPEDLIGKMQSLNLSTSGDFRMEVRELANPLSIRWGNGSDLATKIRIYKELISLPENKKITSIDLSDPKYPIVKN